MDCNMFSTLGTLSKVYFMIVIYIILIAPNPLFSAPTLQDPEAANEAITDTIASVPRQNPPKNLNETAQDGRATTGPNTTYSQELEGTKTVISSMLSISPQSRRPIEGATVEDFERSFNNLPNYVRQRLDEINFHEFARPSLLDALDEIESIGSLDESVFSDESILLDGPTEVVGEPIGFVDQPAIGFAEEPVAGQADNDLNVAPLPLYGLDGGDPLTWELGDQEALGLDPNEFGFTHWPGFSSSLLDFWNNFGGGYGGGGGSGGGSGGGYGGGADGIAKRSPDSKFHNDISLPADDIAS
ncbi:hypothetical protein TWF106_004710 [Orbilia oligospora]|uniref:Uncharacterized protein n=1 Tax=Orbilia oligospora TaxID=2813651 RepID=A0A7C8U8Q6_ORBOL|nr:hypothetical protein TWF106_004710 [Orbilia oligospora]